MRMSGTRLHLAPTLLQHEDVRYAATPCLGEDNCGFLSVAIYSN